MDFSLSTEHEILRKSVKNFAEKEIKPVARELDEREEFSYDTMKAMAELGLFGVFVSEEYEGQGMDFVSSYDGDQGRSSSRRVQGARKVHRHDG